MLFSIKRWRPSIFWERYKSYRLHTQVMERPVGWLYRRIGKNGQGVSFFVKKKQKNNKSQSWREKPILALQYNPYIAQEESKIFRRSVSDDAGQRLRHCCSFLVVLWTLALAVRGLLSFLLPYFFQIEKFREIITRESGV